MTYPVSAGYGPLDSRVTSCVKRMQTQAADRDMAMDRVRKVRDGKFAEVWPDQFSERYPTSIVANFVDQAARDFASNLSKLPSLSCSAGRMTSDADRKRAEKKKRIGFNYWNHSKLDIQMKFGADQYLTYGFLPFRVEADYNTMLPVIHLDDPQGAYYELDRWLNTVRYARCYRQNIWDLAAAFPEFASTILFDKNGKEYASQDTEVVHYLDDTWVIMYLPERQNVIVGKYKHGLKRCPVYVAIRPGLHRNPRGQFDDALWIQLAHSVMAALTLEAGHKSVQAPLAVPTDINEIAIGPDNVIVTDSPEKVQRVPLNVPQAAFALGEQLKEEMREGVGFPESRLGNPSASAITGRGISALEGGYDSQIELGQDVIGRGLREASNIAFEMDMTLWPNKSKTISGTLAGESFEVTYVPKRDIGTNFNCEVTYGFASGLSTQSAIVTLLQLRGDQVIDRDTFRRQLPWEMDVDQIQRELDVQEMEDAIKQGIAAGLQATGQMIAQGQIAEASQYFQAATEIIRERRKGAEIADIVTKVFQPPPPPPDAGPDQAGPDSGAPGAPGAGPGGEPLDGVGPDGLPMGVAPGQAGMPPGGRPSVTDLSAGFTGGGKPNLGALIRRRIPTG